MAQSRAFLVLAVVALAACGNGPGGSAGSAGSVSAEEIGAGLESGGYEVEFSGLLSDGGLREDALPPIELRPHVYSEHRSRSDFAGRQRVDPTNEDGPYRLIIRRLVAHDGEEARNANLFIQLPPDVQAGQAYAIKGRPFAEHGEAYGEIHAPGGWRMNGGVGRPPISGEIRIAEIGEALTASFDLAIGRDSDDPNHAGISGRVFQLPLESLESVEDRTIRVPVPD